MQKRHICTPGLRKLRKQANLSQNELANRAGITDTSYQRYEYGERLPNVLTAIAIANILGCTVEEIWKNAPST